VATWTDEELIEAGVQIIDAGLERVEIPAS
jgi:hypothetical protein